MAKQLKKVQKPALSEADLERMKLLEDAHRKKGRQLRVDIEKGDMKEVDEMRELLKSRSESPDEKYQLYYTGITNLLKKYLPKGPAFKEGRQLIYDEKNIFLNRGKKKSDHPNNVRKSDGRMTYQEKMNEMLDVVAGWVSTSQNPTDLYNLLYALNEKYGYGHENYDKTSKNSTYQKKMPKK